MAHPADDPADLDALARHADALAAAVERTLAPWVERVVAERWAQWSDQPLPAAVADESRTAGAAAAAEVVPELRALLRTDVDEQRTNPLAIVRRAARHATAVLAAAGVPEVQRDEQARRIFPDDRYDLTPAAFADLDPSVHEPGLVWGAAKAHVVLRRRRADHPRADHP